MLHDFRAARIAPSPMAGQHADGIAPDLLLHGPHRCARVSALDRAHTPATLHLAARALGAVSRTPAGSLHAV
jgi:hypothetical protein